MDDRGDIPLTPSYTRDPAAAAAANPSAGSFGFASAGAPPSTGLARGLFVAPRTTSVGGVVPAPRDDPLSKLSNAAAAKARKVTGKKKEKAADGSSRRPRKKLAGRVTEARASEAPASSLVTPAANAHKVYDEMPTSFNDEIYMPTMGVGSNNSHWSQTNDDFEGDEDGEGIFDAPKGRAGNYTTDEDKLICNTWLKVSRDAIVGGDQSREAYCIRMKEHFDLHNNSGIERTERSLRSRWSTINKDFQRWAAALKVVDMLNPSGTNDSDRLTIAQNLFQGEEKKNKKGKIKKGRPFTLPHCYEELKDDEKWKPREDVEEETNKRKWPIDLDIDEEEASVMTAREALHQTRLPTRSQKDQMETRKKDKTRRRGKEMMT